MNEKTRMNEESPVMTGHNIVNYNQLEIKEKLYKLIILISLSNRQNDVRTDRSICIGLRYPFTSISL